MRAVCRRRDAVLFFHCMLLQASFLLCNDVRFVTFVCDICFVVLSNKDVGGCRSSKCLHSSSLIILCVLYVAFRLDVCWFVARHIVRNGNLRDMVLRVKCTLPKDLRESKTAAREGDEREKSHCGIVEPHPHLGTHNLWFLRELFQSQKKTNSYKVKTKRKRKICWPLEFISTSLLMNLSRSLPKLLASDGKREKVPVVFFFFFSLSLSERRSER
jgi:hypothetical protein